MDVQVPQKLDAAHLCLWFMSILIFRMNSDFIFTIFYSFVTIIEMAALEEVCPRLVTGKESPAKTLSFCSNFCNLKLCHYGHTIVWSHLFWFPLCGGTGGCQTIYKCTLMMI
uniref:Uncharacterized protein n=1 Tax=Picea sitchensis TaxID=3332 RepID=B8LRQ1_PICSI|nr:unknown [Picea sitchensis]